MASTLELTPHLIPTRTGSLPPPAPAVLLLVVDPAGDGVGVGVVLLALEPEGDGVAECLEDAADGGGVICLDDGGVLTGVEFFRGLKNSLVHRVAQKQECCAV